MLKNIINIRKTNIINLGFIYDKNILANEIYKITQSFSKKIILPGANTTLYNNTTGWEGIPLKNDTGNIGSDGLKFSGSKNTLGQGNIETIYLKNSKVFLDIIKKIETKFKTKVGFTRILKLNKGGYIAPHHDGAMFNKTIYRCHIPIITKYPDVFMTINGSNYFMKPGNLYITNVSKIHSVTNNSNIDRIHIVLDLQPSNTLLSYMLKAIYMKPIN